MTRSILSVENLGKMYQLGRPNTRSLTFRDVVANTLTRPFRRDSYRSQEPAEPFWAIKDVSFEIKQGEMVGVIGRNGAGKSTLLKVLSRITEPTSGRAVLRGASHPCLRSARAFILN